VRYGIVVNPNAGTSSVSRKRRLLESVRDILGGDCVIRGLDTESNRDFAQCAAELAREAEILIVAGGDGTASDAINAVAPETTLSYLPIGSGCALRYALGLPPELPHVARRIKEGRLHRLDLILCDGRRRGFMASVGVEGDIIHRRDALQESGIKGPRAYAMATFGSLFGELDRCDTSVRLDGEEFSISEAVTTIVTKIPYYGYKMKVVPRAVFDDGYLHLLAINSGKAKIAQILAGAFISENKFGTYRMGREIQITAEHERYAQIDGNLYRKGTSFRFEVLPGVLKMWY